MQNNICTIHPQSTHKLHPVVVASAWSTQKVVLIFNIVSYNFISESWFYSAIFAD